MTDQDIKLIHTNTGSTVVLFLNGKTEFYDRMLAQEMNHMGIYIPPMSRKDFDDKRYIFPSDPLFQKAFIEVYYPLSMDSTKFIFEPIRDQCF